MLRRGSDKHRMICVLELCSVEWPGEGKSEYRDTAQQGGELRLLLQFERLCFNFDFSLISVVEQFAH